MQQPTRIDLVIRACVSRAPWVLACFALVSGAALLAIVDPLSGRPRLLLDPSVGSLLPEGDEGRQTLERVEELFGSGEPLLVALVDDDVFRPESLEAIRRISERLESLELVYRVASLSSALHIRGEEGSLRIEPFYEVVPRDPAGLAELRRRALSDPIYGGNLVSEDGRAALVSVYLLDLPEAQILESRVDEEIVSIAQELWPGEQVWVAGSPRVSAELSRLLMRDLTLSVPLVWLAMAGVAFASFRTLRGVLVPILTIGISVLFTLGFISLWVGSLNPVTIAAPAILTVVGFAYAIHVLSAYYDVLRGAHGPWQDRNEALFLTLRHVAMPVFVTAVTTAAGFFSLTVSPLGAIDQFGVFGGVGVLATLVVSLGFAPALLRLLPVPSRRVESRGEDGLDRLFGRLALFDVRERRRILAVGALVTLVSLAGLQRIEIGTATVSNFKRDNPVRLDFESVNRQLQGANAFRVVLETSSPEAFKEPVNLEVVDSLQDFLAEQPEVGGSTSVADYLKAIHQGFQDNAPEAFAIPESRPLVAQLLLLGANEELDEFVDTAFEVANVVVRTSAMDSAELVDLTERIERYLEESVPPHLSAAVTGNSVLLARTMDEIAIGQALSLLAALGIIYVILCLLFTSLRAGLLALIPNALPVVIYFGLLGWSGVTLNTTTGLVACVVLGIAVDDTIHLLAQFNTASKRLADQRRGMEEALRSVGRPVTFTSLALCLGFLMLATSGMNSQVEFGILSAVTLAVAWLIDVTFTPALASHMRIVTLWDALTLNLGRQPQHEIPLFRGLRATQARVVALMSELRSVRAGEQLIEKGASGDEMYVVLDGRLDASVQREGRRVVLRTLQRGDLIGEVGMLRGTRSADVLAETDARLLCITRESLARIERRHPRIATRLLANLSGVLAGRLDSLTQRLS